MSRIAEAKTTFANAIEDELDELARDVRGLISRAREAAKDANRLNDLGASFNGIACTLETAGAQVEDVRTEARAWLAVGKEPIVTTVNAELTQRAIEASRAAIPITTTRR